MRTGRTLAGIFGAIGVLVGLVAVVVGGALVWAHNTQRDVDGFYVSPDYLVETDGYAVVSEDVAVAVHPGDWFPVEGDLTVRFEVTGVDTAAPLFVGIADADELAGYLDGVGHDRLDDVLGPGRDDVTTRVEPGGPPPTPPAAAEGLWTASVQGEGTQTLTWEVERGTWGLAILNADGSSDVAAVAVAAVQTDIVLAIGIGILVFGAVSLLVGSGLVVVGLSGAVGAVVEQAMDRPAAGSPIVVTGRLDPELSRGLWLVKWLLALPHAIALAFLWTAFVLLTLVAGVSILFTGRYPRQIFDFNVGVLRWSWRVTYYAYGMIGTDRYPPFSLRPDPSYPASLDVAYPEHLSRGLVLVKSWLLAIPHYLVVGALTTGLVAATTDGGEVVSGTGLITVLVLIAGGALLFTGRYPRGLHDLLMGLHRWVLRVVAYAALMTDQYPPFRLDPGGDEPDIDPPPSPDEGGRQEVVLPEVEPVP